MANPSKTDLEVHLRFLQECSRISLGDFFLARLEEDCKLRKHIAAKINEAIDNLALVRLAEILRDHGDLVISRRSKSKR